MEGSVFDIVLRVGGPLRSQMMLVCVGHGAIGMTSDCVLESKEVKGVGKMFKASRSTERETRIETSEGVLVIAQRAQPSIQE